MRAARASAVDFRAKGDDVSGDSRTTVNVGEDSSSAVVVPFCLDLASFEKTPPPLVVLPVVCVCVSVPVGSAATKPTPPPVDGMSTMVDSSGDSSSSPAAPLRRRRVAGGEDAEGDVDGCAAALCNVVGAGDGDEDASTTWSWPVAFFAANARLDRLDRLLRLLPMLVMICCKAALRLVAAATDRRRPLPGASTGLSPISSSAERSGEPVGMLSGASAGVFDVVPSPSVGGGAPGTARPLSLSLLLLADELGVARVGAIGVGSGSISSAFCCGDSAGASSVSGRDKNRSNEASCTWCRCAPRMRCCMRSSRPGLCVSK